MVKPKLGMDRMTNQQVVDKLNLVATSMASTDAAPVFKNPDPPLSDLSTHATTMSSLMQKRGLLLAQAQQLTMQIRDERAAAEGWMSDEAEYVDGIANGDPAVIMLAGMEVSDDTATPVGQMPKVENLHSAQGDANGEVDLNWDPVLRGLRNYRVEMTTDPAGLTGWAFKMNAGGKSKASVTGLTSGTRYWFRVIAEGTGPEGAPSDPATKVAP